MTLNEYQKRAKKTAIYPKGTDYPYLGLGGEAGEVLNTRKKEIRDGMSRKSLIKDECGDVLWYVSQILDELGITLEEAAEMNLAKLEDRYESGTISSH